jgi:hypothetical protein
MSAATGDGASELTVKGLVQQVLDGQKSLHADLQVLRPSLEGEKEEDQWLLVLKEPSGESDQLNASIAEVREAVVSCGENWRKHVSKLARGIIVINSVRLR